MKKGSFIFECILDPWSAKSLRDSIRDYPIDLETIANIIEEMREVCTELSPSGAILWLKQKKQQDIWFNDDLR